MVAAEPIPMIQARGTHHEVGCQIGAQIRPQVQSMLAHMRQDLPPDVTWQQMLDKSQLCLEPSRVVYPQYIDELAGIAKGADVPFEEVFLAMCEELWDAPMWRGRKGCTDLIARGPATADGHTLIAHTNDLGPEAEEGLVILKIQAGDEPEFLAVSPGGVGISAAFNAAGISLTGNQVDSHDVRPGVPRLLIVRAILAARRLGEALDTCLLPGRASSYNNIIADANGEVYSMEGSATDCEPIYIEGDILAHANHYTSPAMRPFEADRNTIGGSVIRHNRALRLLRQNFGRHSLELFRTLLADHADYPASICKHGLESVTAFSTILDLDELRAWIGRGRPCQTTFYEYTLEPWTPPQDWPRR
ncbi:MAG: C45 family autoproteolytic acyltransferase/hydrolase [Chloroflexota bacterium]